jgi:biotin carboxylase
MTRILLILPSSTYRATDFVDAAAAIGAEVIVASDKEQALADIMGDRSLRLNLDDPQAAAERIVERAARLPLDAVVAVDDAGVEAAALAADRLGLPHNPPGAVAATRDKARLRERLAERGLPQPAWRVARPGGAVAALAAEVGPPCVLKPVSLSASRGVIRVDDPAEAAAVAARIRGILVAARAARDGPLLVEAFVPGAEVAVEGLLRGGALEVLAVFDKPDPLDGPYFEETIYTTPSRHERGTLRATVDLVGAATKALGLVEGPVHAEARLTPDGPVLLEIAARSIGGLCSRALRFGAGISLEEVILRHAAGLALDDLTREEAASGVMMLPIQRAGVLREVRGQDEARAVPGIVGLQVTVAPGRRVRPLPEGDRYLGFCFARAGDPAAVEAALRAAHARLETVIDDAG